MGRSLTVNLFSLNSAGLFQVIFFLMLICVIYVFQETCPFHPCCGMQSLSALTTVGHRPVSIPRLFYLLLLMVLPAASNAFLTLTHCSGLDENLQAPRFPDHALSISSPGILPPVKFSHFTSLNLPLSPPDSGNHWALRGPSLEACSR